MSRPKVINGSDLMVFSKVGTTMASFACATTCTVNVTAELLETSSKDSGAWKEQDARKLGWNLKSDQLMTIAGYDAVFAAMVARQAVDIEFGVAGNAGSEGMPAEGWTVPVVGYMGKAIITSLDLNAGDNENATYSVSMEGTGPLTLKNSSASTNAEIANDTPETGTVAADPAKTALSSDVEPKAIKK